MRIRAANSKEGLGDFSVRNISDDSILVEERKFKFDSVLNSNSKQVSFLLQQNSSNYLIFLMRDNLISIGCWYYTVFRIEDIEEFTILRFRSL